MFFKKVFNVVVLFWMSSLASAQSLHPLLLDPGGGSNLPRVQANDNRVPGGTQVGATLEIDLEVVWADWRIETPEGPGIKVVAVREVGKSPSIPAPMIRVETGTRIRARIHNALTDSTVTLFGWNVHPAPLSDSLRVGPGQTQSVEFDAGEPGTYFYWLRIGTGFDPDFDEREQLFGAFIVDPVGGSLQDRVFVMNTYSTPIDTSLHASGWIEALTINGLSWPYTERITPAVGDTLRWRFINATNRGHPMHLHGFYYDVLSIGSAYSDDIYEFQDRRKVVTERMGAFSTMALEWVPSRPGNWLFHCHISFHISPELRLPLAESEHAGHSVHMRGLVLGIEVGPGPSDVISKGNPRELDLFVNSYGRDSTGGIGFSLNPPEKDGLTPYLPGPTLFLQQYQNTFVTVHNNLSASTSVHWHGLELDSWADGVPEWSASDGMVSPAIKPGDNFTYKLSLLRAGTFIYHSHLNDIHQLTRGLYGPLIVLPEGVQFDPTFDHINIVGWMETDPKDISGWAINGKSTLPDQHVKVGERHRIRLINIAPAGLIGIKLTGPDGGIAVQAIAVDGADLPLSQQTRQLAPPGLGVGSTADYLFLPEKPGIYDLFIGFNATEGWHQKWVVSDK